MSEQLAFALFCVAIVLIIAVPAIVTHVRWRRRRKRTGPLYITITADTGPAAAELRRIDRALRAHQRGRGRA